MRSLLLGLFAFYGLLFTWAPADAQCPNCSVGQCVIIGKGITPSAALAVGATLSTDGQALTIDGRVYKRGTDGVFRLAEAGCPCTHYCSCDATGLCVCRDRCKCANCPGKTAGSRLNADQSKLFSSDGGVYYLHPDGVYRAQAPVQIIGGKK